MEINFQDAQQAMGFLTPQMLRINTAVEMMRYPSFDYSRLMYVNTEGDMWDAGSVFYSGDIAGAAKFLSGKGLDMPFADVSTAQHLQTNHLAGIGYQWSRQELERAARLGRNLSSEKADAARQVAESFVYGIAMRGHAEKGLTGLVNNADVPGADVANDGTGPSRLWANKDADLVLRDVNEALNAPFNATKETYRANTLLLPSTRMQSLAERRVGDTTMTILAFLRENNSYTLETGQPLTIIGSRELETAGDGGTKRMVAYDNSRGVVQLHLPGPHEFLPPFQTSAMGWEVAGILNVGGVEVRRPTAMAYRDGF